MKMFSIVLKNKVHIHSSFIVHSAGHATTLLRQRDNVFRSKMFWVLHYVFFVTTPLRNRHFSNFFCHWCSITLSRCRCGEAKKLLRAQLRLYIINYVECGVNAGWGKEEEWILCIGGLVVFFLTSSAALQTSLQTWGWLNSGWLNSERVAELFF